MKLQIKYWLIRIINFLFNIVLKINRKIKRDGIPVVDNFCICIANLENQSLAAVISSYFSEPNTYFPLFYFPEVNAPYAPAGNFDFEEDEFLSKMIGAEEAVLINNAMARIGGNFEYVIFAGLTENQKTYLEHYFAGRQIIEINDVTEADSKLSEIGVSNTESLRCKDSELLEGLFVAKKQNKKLILDNNAESVSIGSFNSDIIITIENTNDTTSVMAVNYAHSVNADIKILKNVSNGEGQKYREVIQAWYESGANNYPELNESINHIKTHLNGIDFLKYKYATFFTKEAIPYSLAIDNVIPCSYVNLKLRPDLFIFNNIVFSKLFIHRFNSAIVFSPGFFSGEEETDFLVDFLNKNKIYIKKILNRESTVANLDFYASHFPYDILHICSHGGEVEGYSKTEKFHDRKGNLHSVEYDEVIGFSPIPGTDLANVISKVIPRKFDGFEWMSDELKNQKIPQYVYVDMRKFLFYSDRLKRKVKRTWKDKIPTSCSIRCAYDSIHQGMFRSVASHSSPIIFNNTCWSWYQVSTFFINAGARGYIGTLWGINNTSAIMGAEIFYKNIFRKPAILALNESLKALSDTKDKNIYVYWGLHFGKLKKGFSRSYNNTKIFKELKRSLYSWIEKIVTTKNDEVRKNSLEVCRGLYIEIIKNFGLPRNSKIEALLKSQDEVIRQTKLPIQSTRTFDYKAEYNKSSKST